MFNGKARDLDKWYLKFSFIRIAPQKYTMMTFGENQVLFYANNYDFKIWDITQNESKTINVNEYSSGNALKGP